MPKSIFDSAVPLAVAGMVNGITEVRRQEALLTADALQSAIINSATFSSIATDSKGVIQLFNVGAERMLGYKAAEVIGKMTPADASDPLEVIARGKTLSIEFATPIAPGFESLVYKASRGIEDIYELTYIRKDGLRFPAVVSVTALRDAEDVIIGYLLIGTDNTARKQAEEALLRAGALQRAIFSSANFSCIATDARGVVQVFNAGAERMLGYTAAEVVDKITPADLHDPLEMIARAKALSAEIGTPIAPGFEALAFKASRGIEDIYEATKIRKDGSRLPAMISITALRDAHEEVIGFLLLSTDNTARKQAESEQKMLDQRLRDQQFYTRSLIESNIDALMTTDPKGIITDVNKQMEALTGCTRDELIGAPFKDYFTEPERAEAGIKQVLAEGKVADYELIARSLDGKETVVSYNASTFYDRNRRLQGVFAAARDVTAQKQASQYARSLIEASLDPLVTISLDGKITDVNDATVKVTGVVREELVGSDFSNYFTEPARAQVGYQQVFAKSFVSDYPLTIRHRDGKLIDVLYNASVYKDVGGNVLGVFAAARDITERKRLDQVLLEKNAELEGATLVAEKANLAKSEFLSSMSHELRSPLNAILGFAQLMESDSPPPTLAQRESISLILQAGWHLLKLIDEILDLAKVESGQVPLSMEPVSLADVMLESQGMFEAQAQQRGMRISFPRFDAPHFVWADRTRLKQVLINLLSNAIKYNIPQGSIEVQCRAVNPNRVRVSIRDSGVGLSAEQLAQLFQPFNRLGQEAGMVEGTGIGLVVAKRLIELMGGVIGVESRVGMGSVFWVELDSVAGPQFAMDSSETVTRIGPKVAHSARPHTLLYVEDNPANMKLVERIIARLPDIRLLTAVNGDLGIEMAREHRPDVILTDIDLPGISGLDVLKILRSEPTLAHTPVIAISANAMPADIKRGLRAGFFRYLTKPFAVNEFLDALQGALELTEKNSLANGETQESL